MTKISCKVQEIFLGRYFVKNFLAAVLLALPDIFQHCWKWETRIGTCHNSGVGEPHNRIDFTRIT
jgi:hypothetical protein